VIEEQPRDGIRETITKTVTVVQDSEQTNETTTVVLFGLVALILAFIVTITAYFICRRKRAIKRVGSIDFDPAG